MQCVVVCVVFECVCMPHYAWNNSKPQLSLNVRAVSLNQWRPFLFQTSSATAWKSIDLNLSLQRPAVFSSYESVHCVEIAFSDSKPIPLQQQQEHQMLSLSSSPTITFNLRCWSWINVSCYLIFVFLNRVRSPLNLPLQVMKLWVQTNLQSAKPAPSFWVLCMKWKGGEQKVFVF